MQITQGRKNFHVKFINWSYRRRGNAARAQRNRSINREDLSQKKRSRDTKIKECLPINKIVEIILIRRIFKYSATKSKANPPLPYSTLNPDTNSDSPSAKSKGARLVSAKVVINQSRAVGNKMKPNQIWVLEKEFKHKVYINIKGIRKIKAMDTS